jgi:hypothetical protein
MPAFALERAPRPLLRPLRCTLDAPLPLLRTESQETQCEEIRSFGSRLEPRFIVRAGPLDQ